MTGLADEATEACRRLLGAAVLRAEPLGGRRRGSVRVLLGDRSVVATKRKRAERARLEAEVLRARGARGAPVPRLVAFDGAWLIQEDLGATRLPQALAAGDGVETEALLDAALSALAATHRAGRSAGLERQVSRAR